MARQIANSWKGRTSRRLRKKIEMLFAHLKRILKLDPKLIALHCFRSFDPFFGFMLIVFAYVICFSQTI